MVFRLFAQTFFNHTKFIDGCRESMYNKDVGNRKFMKELKNEKEYCSRVNLAMAIVTFPVSAQSKNVQLHKSTVIGDKTQRAYQIS